MPDLFYPLLILTLISAGERRIFVLKNDTPYDFKLMTQASIGMDKWDFPETIAAHSQKEIEVQFNSAWFSNWRLAQGYAVYELSGPRLSFAVKAIHTAGKDQEDPDIYVIFMNFSNLGTRILKGFWSEKVDNGKPTFDLYGQPGNFSSHSLENEFTLFSASSNWTSV